MKTSLIGIAAIASLLTTSALAADLAPRVYTKAPPPVAVYDWTGFYIGGNVGYSWGRSSTTQAFSDSVTGTVLSAAPTKFDLNGVIGGGQLGYNWQAGNLVLGIEADVDGSGQSNSGTLFVVGCGATCPGSLASSERVSAFGTARGRVGFAVDRWMFYATGGLSWQSDATSYSFTTKGGAIVGIGSSSATRAGYAIGGGIETALSGNWTGGLEYLYLDTGSFNSNTTTIPAPGIGPFPALSVVTDSTRVQNNIVRARLNYRF
jgi:outer membrane immunogenic protein